MAAPLADNPDPAFGQVWEYDARFTVMLVVLTKRDGRRGEWIGIIIDTKPQYEWIGENVTRTCYLSASGWVYLYG